MIPHIGNYFWLLFPLCLLISSGLPTAFKFTFFYLSAMSLVSIFWPDWHTVFSPPGIDPAQITPELRGESMVFFCSLLAFTALLQIRIPDLKRAQELCGWGGFVTILLYGGGTGLLPVFNNPSLAAVFVILCLGFEFRYATLAGLAAALLVFSRSGVMAWCVGVALTHRWIWWRSAYRIRVWTWLLAGSAVAGGVAYTLFETAQRGLMWSRFWDLYDNVSWPTWTFGAGPGTLTTWFEHWQGLMLGHNGITLVEEFHHVHNDYLQLLFDSGAIGLGLAAYSVGWVLWHCSHENRVPLLVTASVAVIYFPLHYPPTLLLTMLLFKRAWDSCPKRQEARAIGVDFNVSPGPFRKLLGRVGQALRLWVTSKS